ncbi:photosystem I reaction center subunit XII [Moorena producens PAL-8-15-08-1]|uniref:Photosystem I reaction center subunit XII n=1 Tax=Moorena producens PAL-8-15-08-1 TaxID=1458985 RepID=A0A1D8TS26_9CYAN|nr:phycobilisome linker polypeptide [Moorena producens]AOX00417.1 photosystem I reaction center subunit XII [Moorena producens PAL-8-15-08-1]
MLGKSLIVGSSNSPSESRTFVYEVTGLWQNEENKKNSYPLRKSSSIFIQVPYSQMNEEMQRITRMGGKIVSIRPLMATT